LRSLLARVHKVLHRIVVAENVYLGAFTNSPQKSENSLAKEQIFVAILLI
jgi:hypothetical protein